MYNSAHVADSSVNLFFARSTSDIFFAGSFLPYICCSRHCFFLLLADIPFSSGVGTLGGPDGCSRLCIGLLSPQHQEFSF